MPGQNYVLQERSEERVPEEGVTHTSDPGARLWPVEVHFSTGLRPSRETVRAVSAAQALEFVAARYRFADMARTRVIDDTPKPVAPAPAAPPNPPAAPPQSKPSPVRSGFLPTVTPGEPDALGRITLSQENIEAAAILHASGRATWEQLATTIGCNRDHLRRKVGAFLASQSPPQLPPPAPAEPATAPMVGFLPTVGWIVAISTTAEAMAAAGITSVQPLTGRR